MRWLVIRVFGVIPPGMTLVCIVVGVGTVVAGLTFGAAYFLGVVLFALARYLDNYGLESE